MFLKDLFAELEHILGIAAAAAPIVAVVNPNAAASVGSAEAAVHLMTPVVNNVVNSIATAQTAEDVATNTQNVLNLALAIGQATGKVDATKAAAIQALAPALVATAVAASRPVTPSVPTAPGP